MPRASARMLCTSCGHIAVPDTWVPGSDRAELAAWCLMGAPGFAYCALRHARRVKLCANCGGEELMREARRSRREAHDPSDVSRVFTEHGTPWPRALAAPKARLRRGAALAAGGLACVVALFAGTGHFGSVGGPAVGQASALVGMSWLFLQMALLHRAPAPWQAWDERGRPLDIDRL
ncbi:MAG: hypothetical protein AAF430_16235 [Myxococcota bacterium]